MDKSKQDYCVARVSNPDMASELSLDFSSGYVQRSVHLLPKQGNENPWRLFQNYFLDFLFLKTGSLQDDAMNFHRAGECFTTQEDDEQDNAEALVS
jgi:hypothetical protein